MEIPRHIRTAEPACSSTPQIHRNLSESACPHIPTRGANRDSTAQWERDRAGLRRVDRRGRVRAVHGTVEPPGGRRVRVLADVCARRPVAGRRLRFGCVDVDRGAPVPAPGAARRGAVRRVRGRGPGARVSSRALRQGRRTSPPVGRAAVDVAASGLVLDFLPEPGAAVVEAARVVVPGGLVAAYAWDDAEGMGCAALLGRRDRRRSHVGGGAGRGPPVPYLLRPPVGSVPGRAGPAPGYRLARSGRQGTAAGSAPGAAAGSGGRLDRAPGTCLGHTGPRGGGVER